MLALAGSAYLYQAAGGISDGMTILDAGWPLAMLLPAAAAWRPARPLGTVRLEGVLRAVPSRFGLTALAIPVYGQFETLNTRAVALAATAILAVIVRMTLTFRDKSQLFAAARLEAETDALTGIGNRRKLMTDLEATLVAGCAALLMLLDLDGRSGRRRRVPHRRGRVLHPRPSRHRAAPLLRGRRPGCASRAGRGFRVTAPQGSVSLPEEAAEVAEALRVVDERMYDEKGRPPSLRGRQSRDVLLRVLYERDARLQGHLTDLVALRAVGSRLGLPPDDLGDLSLAAELHQVGRLAIPDSYSASRAR